LASPEGPALLWDLDARTGRSWDQLLAARDGFLWLVTAAGKIFRLAGDELTVMGAYEGPLNPDALCLFGDRRGTIWAGTHGGLVRFADGVSTTFTAADGLVDGRVLSLFEDREGSLWIGTYNGLNRFKRSRFETLTAADGLSADSVYSAFESSDGNVWIASPTGVVRYSEGRPRAAPVAGRLAGRIQALLEDSRERLWVGTSEGLFHLDGDTWKRYDRSEDLARTAIHSLSESRSGEIWVGTSTRAIRLGQDGVATALELDGSPVADILEDRQGDLWFATGKHLFQRRATVLISYPPEDSRTYRIREIRQDPSGVLWLGTVDSGLLRFEDGRFTEFNTANGLYDDHVWHSAEDAQGVVWMCSDRGLFTAVRRELEELARGERTSISSVSYGLSDGLKNLECNGVGDPAGLRRADGKLWFMTAGGVVIVDPDHLDRNPVIPDVLIEKVEIDGITVLLKPVPLKPVPLKTPVGARQIEVR
ncbi:MAG: hypothetical protein GY925_30050, partial [Actinomycetia bacterium]|nr:hypothetical protein [Actinomycetes bacterium]